MISWTLQPSFAARSVASEAYAFCSAATVSYGSTAKRTGLCGQAAAAEAVFCGWAAAELSELDANAASASAATASGRAAFFIGQITPWSRSAAGSLRVSKLVKTRHEMFTHVDVTEI